MKDLITVGEFARLAGTTKRTIVWYDEKGILKPYKTASNGYRYYKEAQVLDFQMILLLTQLGVTLDEIKSDLSTSKKLISIFNDRKEEIRKQIKDLSFNLENVETYLANIASNKTMIKPTIKALKPFDVYYIEQKGAYVDIANFCDELLGMLDFEKSKGLTTMAIFRPTGYQPKSAEMRIAAFGQNLKVKDVYKNKVQRMKFSPGKVISYIHIGDGAMLSLFWKELEKYCKLNKIKIKKDKPDFEIYHRISKDKKKQVFEIFLPIE